MITCEVEEHIPIPTGASKPYKDVRAKAAAACNAAKLLEEEGYTGNDKSLKDSRDAAKAILNSLAKGQEPQTSVVNSAMSTPGGAYMVRSILQEYDMEIVHEAKSLRHYVTNKLIVESDNSDARIRMKALELLGKISDVGLFSERTEVTVTNKSTGELVEVLKSKLNRLRGGTGEGADVQDAVILPHVEVPMTPIDLRNALSGF